MTLDEAIKHCKEKAEELRTCVPYTDMQGNLRSTNCDLECASEHEQLAEWLTELKELRELVHLLLMCGIMDKTALESGNVTNGEWLRMMNLIDKYQTEGGIKCEPDKSGDLISREALLKELDEYNEFALFDCEAVKDLINDAPSIGGNQNE